MISVVIPAFNSERCISRAIESVMSQTFSDYEIIVVDDGSTDGTADIVKKFGDRVRYVYQQNAGPASARNAGLKIASGQWIAFLDADDEWLPDKLQQQVELLDRNRDLRWCSTNRYQADERRKAPVGNKAAITKALNGREHFPNYFSAAAAGKCPIVTSTIIVRKDVFDKLGDFDLQYLRGQDLDMWWRIAHHYPKIGYIPQPLAVRHLDAENPIVKKRRHDAWKGHTKRKLIDKHLLLSKKCGKSRAFNLYATKFIKASFGPMLLGGYKESARQTLKQFKNMFPFHFRLLVYLLTIFPKITAFILRVLLKFLFIFSSKVVRIS